jgi:predicted anti-sigma-YlaC factor YlaD
MSANCERARAWASLRLDGELSELEQALLTAHVSRCEACREYEERVSAAVLVLRSQPLEPVEHPVAVSARRRARVRPLGLARVAAVAAAVFGVTTVLGTESPKGPSSSPPAQVSVLVNASVNVDEAKDIRAGRVIQLGGRPPQGSSMGSFGAVLSDRNGP